MPIKSPAAPPTILRVLTRLGSGGPPIHALLLTRELRNHGYRTYLAVGRCQGDDGDMSYLLDPGDPICFVPRMSRSMLPWNDIRAFFHLLRLMRRLRPDIVHTHTAKAGALGRVAAWFARVPVVVHTFHGNVLSGYFSAPVNAALAFVERALARITSAICVVGPQQASEIAERFRIAPRWKVNVIRLAIPTESLRRISAPEMRPHSPTVGWLGRFVPIKNVELLVHVVERTIAAVPDVRFVIGGDGPQRGQIEALCARFPRHVAWTGWRNDVLPLIQECSVLLQTSINEGTPLALIQGMAAGRPFISTRAGGTVDLAVGEAKTLSPGAAWHDNCILCDSDADAVATAIARLFAQPSALRSMSASACAASAAYDASRLVHEVHELYTELLADRRFPQRTRRGILALRTP